MLFEKLKFTVEDGIASIVLSNPKTMNSLDLALVIEVVAALDMCEKDDTIKVVVISGDGKAFSGGGDINYFYQEVQKGSVDIRLLVKMVGQIALKIKKLPKPVIASVHGAVAGGGFGLALSCDFCIAAENAKFIQAFINLGFVPDTGSLYILAKSVGVHKATDWMMTGRIVTAQEAKDAGIVYEVTTAEGLQEATLKLATKFANGPSKAYAYIKDMLYQTSFKEFESFLFMEGSYQNELSQTQDFREAVLAFVEKRKAEFKGE